MVDQIEELRELVREPDVGVLSDRECVALWRWLARRGGRPEPVGAHEEAEIVGMWRAMKRHETDPAS
jgi:hypothetical protein